MADNVGYTPGVGEIIGTDDCDGVQYQVIKIAVGEDGVVDNLVSVDQPLPTQVLNTVSIEGALTDAELRATPIDVQLQGSNAVDLTGESIGALEATRMGVQSLLRSIGQVMPDTANRLRVNIEVGSLSTVTTVTTLSNQTQIGGNSAFEQIPALMRLAADALRRNINVT